MWPTRALGSTSSMPSRKPLPARRMAASTIFLPSITRELMVSSGVSIAISCSGRSRVTS